MTTQEETNIANNQSQMFRPHLKRAKNVILGEENPNVFSQVVFYTGVLGTFISGIWSFISYVILKNPLYLKQHKQVDVEAIVELRGRELGYTGDSFFRHLELFHLSSTGIWVCILIGFIFLWRQKKWSAYIIISGLIIYCALMLFFLGPTYFVEDTTLFDKLSLLVLFLLVLIHHFVTGNKKNEIPEEEMNEAEERMEKEASSRF